MSPNLNSDKNRVSDLKMLKEENEVVEIHVYEKTGLQSNVVNSKLKDYCYTAGVNAFRKKDYDSAATYLTTAGNYKNSKDLLKECIYRQGIERLVAKEFDQGAALFRKCGKYKFAQDLVRVCTAESYYANGSLNEALSVYSKVSSKVSVPGFNIQGRKASIATERSLIKIQRLNLFRKSLKKIPVLMKLIFLIYQKGKGNYVF